MKKHYALVLALSFALPAMADWSPIGISFLVADNDVALGYPSPYDSVYGLDLNLFAGKLFEMYGVSFSTLGIKTSRAAGIEVSGICNITDTANDGVMQIAGVFNCIDSRGEGMQIAGLCNSAETFTGLQVAFFNYAKEPFTGMQAGFINIGLQDFHGVQIGVVNAVNELHGIQIGLCNIVASSDIVLVPIVRIGF